MISRGGNVHSSYCIVILQVTSTYLGQMASGWGESSSE